jgi:hypothetical protein
MVPYKGYLIVGNALPVYPNSSGWWRSQGRVFTNAQDGSVLVKTLEGVIFESKKAAEAQGLELCKKWVEENRKASEDEQ